MQVGTFFSPLQHPPGVLNCTLAPVYPEARDPRRRPRPPGTPIGVKFGFFVPSYVTSVTRGASETHGTNGTSGTSRTSGTNGTNGTCANSGTCWASRISGTVGSQWHRGKTWRPRSQEAREQLGRTDPRTRGCRGEGGTPGRPGGAGRRLRDVQMRGGDPLDCETPIEDGDLTPSKPRAPEG